MRLRPELQIVEAHDGRAGDGATAYLFEAMTADDRVWVAFVDDELIGGLRLTLASGETGLERIGPNVVIHTVSVHGPHQGRGFGRAVMEFAEQWVQAQPQLPNTLSLAVDVGNAVAIGLYESLGYGFVEVHGSRLRTSDQRCFVMTKSLGG